MPAHKSSGNGGPYKVSRKVRVAEGNSKRSVVGLSSSSNVDRAHRKLRTAIRGFKVSDDVVRTVISKNRGIKEVQIRDNCNDAIHVDVNDKLGERRSRGKGGLNRKNENERFETVIDRNSGRKPKRVYPDSKMVEAKTFDGNERKSRFYLDRNKKVPRGKDREFKDFSRKTLLTGSSKLNGSDLRDNKFRRGKMEGADKVQHVLGNGSPKTIYKNKALLATKKDLNQRKYAIGSIQKPPTGKDTSDLMVDPPKKKKRVIKIDPHDISNKRLDDDIANNGKNQGKIDLAENTGVEMSKNAQFRAIRPSSSIISFVEDNLLGRRRDIDFRRAGYNTELSAPLDNIPFSTSSERERVEIPVFRNKLEFFAAAKISSSFPPPDLPEIAFAGRSNVGKSSLLNALTRQWGVVRTSDKPGLTQTINFFKLGSKQCLVDLPGYGFAYAKEEVKEAWEELAFVAPGTEKITFFPVHGKGENFSYQINFDWVKEYVTTRVGLKRVCLLVDTKWGMKPRDHELIDLMERSETKYQIVLTKTDSVFPIDVARRAMQIEENLKAKRSAVQPLMMVSSKTGAGIRSLRTVLANVARLVRR